MTQFFVMVHNKQTAPAFQLVGQQATTPPALAMVAENGNATALQEMYTTIHSQGVNVEQVSVNLFVKDGIPGPLTACADYYIDVIMTVSKLHLVISFVSMAVSQYQ